MKFSDILKTIGLANGNGNNFNNNSGISAGNGPNGRFTTKVQEPEVDRIYHGYQHYQMQNPYQHQMEFGASPAIGNFYYPATYNMYGQRDYGLKLGNTGHAHGGSGTGGGDAVGGHHGMIAAGHGHTGYGYGSTYGGGGGSGGGSSGAYDYGYSTPRQKSKGSSVMTALTLLSFFFFINLLQNCLKEHMDAMNPTVMVMTAGSGRTRITKLTEKFNTDSRESPEIVQDVAFSVGTNTDLRIDSTYPNITRPGIKIKTKLKNDFYREGDDIYLFKN